MWICSQQTQISPTFVTDFDSVSSLGTAIFFSLSLITFWIGVRMKWWKAMGHLGEHLTFTLRESTIYLSRKWKYPHRSYFKTLAVPFHTHEFKTCMFWSLRVNVISSHSKTFSPLTCICAYALLFSAWKLYRLCTALETYAHFLWVNYITQFHVPFCLYVMFFSCDPEVKSTLLPYLIHNYWQLSCNTVIISLPLYHQTVVHVLRIFPYLGFCIIIYEVMWST